MLIETSILHIYPYLLLKRKRGGSSRGGGSAGSAQSTPRKQRGARLSASLKVRGLLGRVWARDSKSKSCENLHVL